MSRSLWAHGLQHARLPCPSPSPGSLLKHMFIESVMSSNHFILCGPLSYCAQSFPASEYFPMSWLFASGGQRTGASGWVLQMNIQDWFSLGLTGSISLQSKGLASLLQHHSLKASILPCSAFFIIQLSHPYMTTGKTIALTRQTCWQSNVSAF